MVSRWWVGPGPDQTDTSNFLDSSASEKKKDSKTNTERPGTLLPLSSGPGLLTGAQEEGPEGQAAGQDGRPRHHRTIPCSVANSSFMTPGEGVLNDGWLCQSGPDNAGTVSAPSLTDFGTPTPSRLDPPGHPGTGIPEHLLQEGRSLPSHARSGPLLAAPPPGEDIQIPLETPNSDLHKTVPQNRRSSPHAKSVTEMTTDSVRTHDREAPQDDALQGHGRRRSSSRAFGHPMVDQALTARQLVPLCQGSRGRRPVTQGYFGKIGFLAFGLKTWFFLSAL